MEVERKKAYMWQLENKHKVSEFKPNYTNNYTKCKWCICSSKKVEIIIMVEIRLSFMMAAKELF